MRQNIVKKIRKSKNYSKILECLKTLKENESALLWILKEKTKEEKHIIDSVYFKNKWLKGLNDNEQVMNFYNYFRILFSPIYGLLSPLVFMIVPFIYLRLFTGVKIPFTYLYGSGRYFNKKITGYLLPYDNKVESRVYVFNIE